MRTTTENQSIVDAVKRILADISRNDAVVDMDLDTKLRDELGIDSMTSLTFLMALEDNIPGFFVDADTLEVEHFLTIGSICDYVLMQLDRAVV